MSPRNTRRAQWPWRHTLTEAIRATRHERGTVLLMVVGVLALLAIIGVVYATIGRADRSISATTQKNQRVSDQAEEIAAYLAKVIGNATFAQYVERTEGPSPYSSGQPWRYRTRGYTYPRTDDYFLSINPTNYGSVSGAQNLVAIPGNQLSWYTSFSPTGENLIPWNGVNIEPDPREPSDPYLAVLEPEWLRLTPTSGNGELFDRRDWRHISDFAPSGNFVNLANLRRNNTHAPYAYGGFEAGPGFNRGNATTLPGISYGLTLYSPTTGLMQAVGTNQQLAGAPAGTFANPATPAHWSNNQILAFQPAVPDSTRKPYEYEYVLNQWADADGDGFLDSRWFELTDISAMFGGTTSAIKQIVPARGRYRLFCAARCVDNSAKVNVNVACDMMNGPFPTATFMTKYANGDTDRYLTRDDALPPGISPADIALNRVLRLSDINVSLATLGAGPVEYGYKGIPQPTLTASDRTSTNYTNYDTIAKSDAIGNAAYMALIDARRRGPTAEIGTAFSTYATKASERFQHYDVFAADTRSARPSIAYGSSGTNPQILDPTKRVLRSPYDLSDELELATYFGVNDSDTLSRLEATLGGRDGAFASYSPLRDNRPRSLEMAGRDEFDQTTMFIPANGRASLLSAYTDIRHLLTTVNGSRPMKDEGVAPESPDLDPAFPAPSPFLCTDVSAALKAISNFSRFDRAPRSTDPARTSTTPFNQPTSNDYNDFQRAVQLIFKLYANSLVPYTNTQEFPNAWMTTPLGTGANRSGLVYGGNAELALRMAAHMTANLVDAFDRDRTLDGTTTGNGRPNTTDRNDPTAVTLALAQMTGPNRGISGYPAEPRATKQAYAGGTPLNLNAGLPTGISRLPDTRNGLPSYGSYSTQLGKMTVFGIEAQPFITELGTMALYTDAPKDAGGDEDWENPDPTGGGGVPLFETHITIKMEPKLSNSDFICELIAFQLTNPFEEDVILFDPAATGGVVSQHKYYLEYGARYYSFKSQDMNTVEFAAPPQTVRLKAGHTRTFYAVNPGTLKAVGQRIKRINVASRTEDKNTAWNTDDEYTAAAKAWIENQLKSVGSDDPIQLTQINPHTFDRIQPVNPTDPQPDMNLWSDQTSTLLPGTENLNSAPHGTAELRVCHLWKTIRSRSSLLQTPPGGLNGDEISVQNDPTNDFLADRLHDPSDAGTGNGKGYLWSKRDVNGGANQQVGSAVGGDDHAPGARALANTGFTAIIWGSIRRPTDTKQATAGTPGGTLDANGRPIRGVLPPWCLEARCDNKWSIANKRSLNKVFHGEDDQGSEADYSSAGPQRFKKMREALDPSKSPANPEIGLPCFKKGALAGRANPIGKTKDLNTALQREYSQVAVEYHSVGEDIYGGPENPTPPGALPSGAAIRRSRNPALFSRAGDFLLPLAVGPWFDPSREGVKLTSVSSLAQDWIGSAATQVVTADREAAWMTLSEALALSCGYYSPQDPTDALYEFGVHSTGTPTTEAHVPRTDRGHLVLNAYTPFLQINDGQPQPLGSGVPFALSIIDQFRAATGISSTPKLVNPTVPENVAPEQQTRDTAFGGGSTSLYVPQSLAYITRREGVMNINTCTLNTLRTLPMIAPEEDTNSWMRNPGAYFSTSNNNAPLFNYAGAPDYDLAPTLKGYRDRSKEAFRRIGTPQLAARFADFSVPNARYDLTQPPSVTNLPLDMYRRTARGFKSLGELVAANIYSSRILPGSTLPVPIADVNSMFRFSEPERDSGGAIVLPTGTLGNSRKAQRSAFSPAIFSSRFFNIETIKGEPDKQGPTAFPTDTAAPIYAMGDNELPGGYQQKLAIINALTNTASVRSDVFTVYFVIHGYTPDDCDVADDQPLVPSVAKRYVMVVDRSNVVAPGDKPRILLLKEVPMQ